MFLFPSKIVRRCIAFFLVFASLGAIFYVGKTNLKINYDYGFFRCVAGFFTGVLKYELYSDVRDRSGGNSKYSAVIQSCLLIGTAIFIGTKSQEYTDFAIIPLVSLTLLATALSPNSIAGKFLNLKPLRWCGSVSYSIYITHPAVLWFYYTILKYVLKTSLLNESGYGKDFLNPSIVLDTLFFMMSMISILIVSEYTYRWIENPFRVWSKKHTNSKARIPRTDLN